MIIRNIRSMPLVALSVIFAVIFFSGVSASPAYAETKIAVVDVDVILTSSKAAKSIKKQVDQKRNGFLDNVKKEEDKLRTKQKAIEEKRADMTREELVKKAQEFEERRIAARKKLQDKKAKLDKSYSKAMNKLTDMIDEVCQEIADEQKIDLIITRQNIIIGSKSLDITSEVMSRMNKNLPSLSLE